MKLKIQSSCDIGDCESTFDLGTRGIFHIRSEWKRAKSLGWSSFRKPSGKHVDVLMPSPDVVRFSAGKWIAVCPKHK